jgi:hypothetical protein
MATNVPGERGESPTGTNQIGFWTLDTGDYRILRFLGEGYMYPQNLKIFLGELEHGKRRTKSEGPGEAFNGQF